MNGVEQTTPGSRCVQCSTTPPPPDLIDFLSHFFLHYLTAFYCSILILCFQFLICAERTDPCIHPYIFHKPAKFPDESFGMLFNDSFWAKFIYLCAKCAVTKKKRTRIYRFCFASNIHLVKVFNLCCAKGLTSKLNRCSVAAAAAAAACER